jgi:hypothetical protein
MAQQLVPKPGTSRHGIVSAVKEILLTVAHHVYLGCEEDRDYRKSE